MRSISTWAFAVVLLGTVSCQNEAPKTVAEPQKTTETTAASMPETALYVVAFDQFRIRETPDPKGKELAKMAKGDLFEGTGRVSGQKFEMKIGEMEHNAPFVEGVSKGVAGWAFGAGLLRVFEGKKNDLPDAAFGELAAQIGKLSPDAVESGKKALAVVAASPTKSADAALIVVEKLLNDIVFSPKATKNLESPKLQAKFEAAWKRPFDHSKFAETKALAEAGLQLNTSEGSFFATVDHQNLQKMFAGRLSPAMQRWLDLEVDEDLERTTDDGGIVIPIDQLAERAVAWNELLEKNPHFALRERAQSQAFWLLSELLLGADNTPAFDYESKKLDPDWRKAWEKAVSLAPSSEIAKTIKAFDALVKAEGDVRTPKVEAWIDTFNKKMPD